MKNVLIERFSYAPDGTFGRLTLPSGRVLFTCEQPWNGNAVGESCIPEGEYQMKMRRSPVVQRSSGGKYDEGWEVIGVPGRTFIMIHPANWPHELRGCIAPGMNYAIISGKQGVSSSRQAFDIFMDELDGEETVSLGIYQKRPEYP
jgi:hypothetical protein